MSKIGWVKNNRVSMSPDFEVWDKENERGYYTDRIYLQHTKKNDGKIIWAVGNSINAGKIFKNRSQALKFAKNYMRSH